MNKSDIYTIIYFQNNLSRFNAYRAQLDLYKKKNEEFVKKMIIHREKHFCKEVKLKNHIESVFIEQLKKKDS